MAEPDLQLIHSRTSNRTLIHSRRSVTRKNILNRQNCSPSRFKHRTFSNSSISYVLNLKTKFNLTGLIKIRVSDACPTFSFLLGTHLRGVNEVSLFPSTQSTLCVLLRLGFRLRFPFLQYLFQILMLLEMIARGLVEVEYVFL